MADCRGGVGVFLLGGLSRSRGADVEVDCPPIENLIDSVNLLQRTVENEG